MSTKKITITLEKDLLARLRESAKRENRTLSNKIETALLKCGEPSTEGERRMKPTLEKLNETDNPKQFGGECLGDDGKNQLWLFRSIDKVANRFEDDDCIQWDDDIEGWNYTPDFALE